MSKKFKVITPVLIAALLLTVGGTAVAMAQDEPSSVTQSVAGGLLARVANILGVTQEQLVAAFQQARQEIRQECLATGNCSATGNCTICQENLNRFRERYTEKQQEMRQERLTTENCTMRQEWADSLRERCDEKQQKWAEKEERMLNRFHVNGTGNQENTSLQISPAVRGLQMIAIAR